MDDSDQNYGNWNPRACHWKTPQRLFTLDPFATKSSSTPETKQQQQQPKEFHGGNLFCAPIVVSQRYILVATDRNLTVYGNFDDGGKKGYEESMQQRIDTKAIPPLTKFSLSSDAGGSFDSSSSDPILQMAFHHETGIVYALTSASCVFQVKIILDDPAITSGTASSPRFRVMHNWVTQKLGATCMATRNDGGGKGIDSVCVGYASGHIEAWNVPKLESPDAPPPRLARTKTKTTTAGVSMEWEGYLHDAIRTLSCLESPHREAEPTGNETGNSQGAGNGRSDYYLMAIVSVRTRTGEKGKQESTFPMLKLLDAKRIRSEIQNPAKHGAISLENYSLPQSRGMELIEATTVSLSKNNCQLPKRVPILDSHGANASCNLKSAGSGSFTGLSFPDGITCLLSSNKDAVGVAQPDHQLLLSYPAIGSAQIDIVDESGKPSSYMAACLRGGTCYLIPISTNTNNNQSIATIPYPQDIESDLSFVYVQAFTAGNLVLDGIDLPVLVYAWPGGVIDVYACGLMPSEAPNSNGSESIDDDSSDVLISRAERRCLRDAIDNECISLISKIVDELRENSQHPLLQMEEWQQLFAEIKSGTNPSSPLDDISLESLCSIEHQSLRRILLSLALIHD
jgi:hypothetical protein